MKKIFHKLSVAFSAGALGGLCNGFVVWFFGTIGITALLSVHIAPEISPPFLYNKIVWGGIWGFIILIPIFNNRLLLKGIILSLFPSIVQLCIVFPFKDNKEIFGLALGSFTPIFVLIFNSVWGIVSVYWYKYCSD